MGVLIALVGCGGAQPVRPPDVTKAEARTSIQRVGAEELIELVEARAEIKNLEYTLTTHAAKYCGELTRPRAGVLLADPKKFADRDLENIARERLSLGDAPTVVHLVSGGPFERAGLRTGDELLSVDDEELETSGDFAQLLLESGERTAIRVRFRRNGAEHELRVPLAPACPITFGLATSAMLVPWQHEKLAIAVPLGLVRWSQSDDELAVLTAHQLAHALFDRPDEPELESEARADRLGLIIASGAGYDVSDAASHWERIAHEYPWLILPKQEARRTATGHSTWWIAFNKYPHHGIGDRMPAIRALASELAARAEDTVSRPR
jgi:hypothetical protein